MACCLLAVWVVSLCFLVFECLIVLFILIFCFYIFGCLFKLVLVWRLFVWVIIVVCWFGWVCFGLWLMVWLGLCWEVCLLCELFGLIVGSCLVYVALFGVVCLGCFYDCLGCLGGLQLLWLLPVVVFFARILGGVV